MGRVARYFEDTGVGLCRAVVWIRRGGGVGTERGFRVLARSAVIGCVFF